MLLPLPAATWLWRSRWRWRRSRWRKSDRKVCQIKFYGEIAAAAAPKLYLCSSMAFECERPDERTASRPPTLSSPNRGKRKKKQQTKLRQFWSLSAPLILLPCFNLSVCLPVCLSVCLPVCLPPCLLSSLFSLSLIPPAFLYWMHWNSYKLKDSTGSSLLYYTYSPLSYRTSLPKAPYSMLAVPLLLLIVSKNQNYYKTYHVHFATHSIQLATFFRWGRKLTFAHYDSSWTILEQGRLLFKSSESP